VLFAFHYDQEKLHPWLGATKTLTGCQMSATRVTEKYILKYISKYFEINYCSLWPEIYWEIYFYSLQCSSMMYVWFESWFHMLYPRTSEEIWQGISGIYLC
jgi:hypothetical protein